MAPMSVDSRARAVQVKRDKIAPLRQYPNTTQFQLRLATTEMLMSDHARGGVNSRLIVEIIVLMSYQRPK